MTDAEADEELQALRVELAEAIAAVSVALRRLHEAQQEYLRVVFRNGRP